DTGTERPRDGRSQHHRTGRSLGRQPARQHGRPVLAEVLAVEAAVQAVDQEGVVGLTVHERHAAQADVGGVGDHARQRGDQLIRPRGRHPGQRWCGARVGGAQSGHVSVEAYTYAPVAGTRVRAVLTGGRMPSALDEIVLAPTTARDMHAATGSMVRLAGAAGPRTLTVTGIGFVPSGPDNYYDDGAWLTPAGSTGSSAA